MPIFLYCVILLFAHEKPQSHSIGSYSLLVHTVSELPETPQCSLEFSFGNKHITIFLI